MSSYARRLTLLEGQLPTPDDARDWHRRDVIDRAAPWLAGWTVLRETMAEAHVEHVEAAVLRYCWLFTCRREGELLRPMFHVPFELLDADPLIRQVDVMIGGARPGAFVPHRGPFTLPEPVAAAYRSRPYAPALDECAQCGYHVPRGWFACCPLCGGQLGCLLFYRRTRDFVPTWSMPEDLIEAYRQELVPLVEQLLDEADAINHREQRVAAI